MELKQGDCLDLFHHVPDNSVNLVLVDLPYGTTQNKWDSVIDCEEMWEEVKRVLHDNGLAIFFCKMPFSAALMESTNLVFLQQLIWRKNVASNFLNANRMHLDVHEELLLFKKKSGKTTYNKQMMPGTPYKVKRGKVSDAGENYGKINERTDTFNEGIRNPTTILEFPRVGNNERAHPTEKPVELLSYLIKTFSNEGETVLDFTMGVGSTGAACKETSRKFMGFEKDETYFKDAEMRIGMQEEEWKKFVKKRKRDTKLEEKEKKEKKEKKKQKKKAKKEKRRKLEE